MNGFVFPEQSDGRNRVELLPPEPPVRCELSGADAGLWLGPIPCGAAYHDLKGRLAMVTHLADELVRDFRRMGDPMADRAANRLALVREQVSPIAGSLIEGHFMQDAGV